MVVSTNDVALASTCDTKRRFLRVQRDASTRHWGLIPTRGEKLRTVAVEGEPSTAPRKARRKLLSSQFTLGAEASVAAGPLGRTAAAQTDAQMHADILSWSRSRGLFAGVALEGATLRQDLDDNATLYGKPLENRQIGTTGVHAPAAAAKLPFVTHYSEASRE